MVLLGCAKEETELKKCIYHESTKLRLQPDSLRHDAIRKAGYIHYIPGLESSLIAYAKHRGYVEYQRFNEITLQMQNEPKAQQYYQRMFALSTSDSFAETYRMLNAFEHHQVPRQQLDAELIRCKTNASCAAALLEWENLRTEDAPVYLPVTNIFSSSKNAVGFEDIEQRVVSTIYEYLSALDEKEWAELLPPQLKTNYNNLLLERNEGQEEKIYAFLSFLITVPTTDAKLPANSVVSYLKRKSDFYNSAEYTEKLLSRFKMLTTKPSLNALAEQFCTTQFAFE